MTKVGAVTASRPPGAAPTPRGGDRLAPAEARPDPLGEGRLAGAQRTDEDDEISRTQQAGECPSQRERVLRRRKSVLSLHAAAPRDRATAVRSASNPARRAPLGPNRMAAEGW